MEALPHPLSSRVVDGPQAACGPPKEMKNTLKNTFCPSTALDGSVALPFVIPSAAEGSAVPRTFPGNVFRRSEAEAALERSASQIYRVSQRLWRVVEGTSAVLILPMPLGAFQPRSPREQDSPWYALMVIFSCTVIIFHPQVCARSLNSGLIVR